MELDFVLLADGVLQRPDGKLDVYGAGFDTVFASSVPARHPRLFLAIRVGIARHEAEHPHRVDVILQASDGGELARARYDIAIPAEEQRAQIPPGRLAGLGFILSFDNVLFPEYGAYQFIVQWDGTEIRALPLFVSVPPAVS